MNFMAPLRTVHKDSKTATTRRGFTQRKLQKSIFLPAEIGLRNTKVPTEISSGVDEENSIAWVTEVWCIACITGPNHLKSVLIGNHVNLIAQQLIHELTQTQKKKWTPRKAPDASTSSMSLHIRFLSSAVTCCWRSFSSLLLYLADT